MASFPTPNIPQEQTTKQTIRFNTAGGANSYWSNPVYAPTALVNAAASGNAGLFRLVVSGTNTTAFTISGSNISATGLTGNTTVSGLVSILGAALPSTYTLVVWNKTADYLGGTTTDFIITAPAGTTLTQLGIAVASGVTVPAQVNQVALTAAVLSGSYPNYYGTPNATPTWVDDATVHAYPIYGFGNTTQDTSKTEQKQVRQIRTGNGPDGGLETQIWSGYFAAYQSNLNQVEQKNTKQQQC